MIPIEPSYMGKCIFCTKDTHYRIKRETGVWYEVCEACASSSRTVECAMERHAIQLESHLAEQKAGLTFTSR